MVDKICRDQNLPQHYYYIELQGKRAIKDYSIEGLDAQDDLTE